MGTNLAGSVMPNTPSSTSSTTAAPWRDERQQQQQRASMRAVVANKHTAHFSQKRSRWTPPGNLTVVVRRSTNPIHSVWAATRWEQNGVTSVFFSPGKTHPPSERTQARCCTEFRPIVEQPRRRPWVVLFVFCSTYKYNIASQRQSAPAMSVHTSVCNSLLSF